MKRLLSLSIAALLLAGCGNQNNNVTTIDTGLPPGPATVAPLTITAQNAAILGSSMRDVLNGSGALDDEVSPGSSLSFIQAVSWASVVQEMFNAYPLFAQGSSRTVPGPTGGIAQVTVAGPTTGVIFTDFSVNNVTLHGGVTFTAGPNPQTVNATFREFRVHRLNQPAFQIDGNVGLVESRVTTGAEVDDLDNYRYLFQVTDLATPGSGTAAVDMVVKDDRDINATSIRTVTETDGTIVFNNYRTLTGSVQVINTEPWIYTFPLPNGPVTLSAGGGLVQGNGAIRRTVVAPNVIRTEVQPAGSSTFTPVQ